MRRRILVRTCQPGYNRCVPHPPKNLALRRNPIGWQRQVYPNSEATPEDEIPDWLKSLRSDSGRGEEQIFQSEEASSSAAGQDLPDWLAGMRDASSAPLEAPETGEEQVAQFGEAGPEWLQRLEPSTAPEPEMQLPESGPGELESPETPVFEAELAAAAEPLQPPDEMDSVPEWLAGLTVAAGALKRLERSLSCLRSMSSRWLINRKLTM